MKRIFIVLLILVSGVLVYIYRADMEYKPNKIYTRESNLKYSSKNKIDIQISNERLVNKAKEIIKTVIGKDIDELSAYAYENNEFIDDIFSVKFMNLKDDKPEYLVSFNLISGNITSIVNINGYENKSNEEMLSKDRLIEIAKEKLAKIISDKDDKYEQSFVDISKEFMTISFSSEEVVDKIHINLNSYTGELINFERSIQHEKRIE